MLNVEKVIRDTEKVAANAIWKELEKTNAVAWRTDRETCCGRGQMYANQSSDVHGGDVGAVSVQWKGMSLRNIMGKKCHSGSWPGWKITSLVKLLQTDI